MDGHIYFSVRGIQRYINKKIVCIIKKEFKNEKSVCTDFNNKDKNGEYLYDNIDDPFPDHAIIEADFDIK